MRRICFLLLTFLVSISLNAQQESIEKILDESGAIITKSSGSYNTSGYEMTYGKNNEPIFKKPALYTWSSLGTGRNGTAGNVHAMAVDGSGNIYVGGDFNLAGDIVVSHIAKWDGSSWSALTGGGINGVNYPVRAIAISGSDVYVGGDFTFLSDGSTSANHIAKWNSATTTWSALGAGVTNGVYDVVYALGISGSNVYAGGIFEKLGDNLTSANYIAKWNGSTWSAVTGDGINGVMGWVYAIAISGSDVYVGGSFINLGNGSTTANRIAKWNGSTWSVLTDVGITGVNGTVNAIAINGTDVFVGGGFATLGDGTTAAKYIAKWNTTPGTWSALIDGAINGVSDFVYTIAISGTDVYSGGEFTFLGDGTTSANHIAKWDGSSWSAITDGVINGVGGAVSAIAITGSNVYLGGSFSILGNGTTSANNIIIWNGTGWDKVGVGNNGVGPYFNNVNAIAISGSDVYVGGSFTTLGDGITPANYIAKWNSASATWSALIDGTINGVGGTVFAIAVSGTDVYAGGWFVTLGDNSTPANYIAKWDGSNWSALTGGGVNGVNAQIKAIAISGTNIYVGGWFNKLGNNSTIANRVAKWDGSNWSELTDGVINGVNNQVAALAISGGDLYAGGNFTFLGDGTTPAKRIAKWNGSNWSSLTGSGINGVNGAVSVITVTATDVYAGGNFTLLGDGTTSANYIAKWNIFTASWSALGSGTTNGTGDIVNAIATSGSDVYVGGNFTTLGDYSTPANHLAKWNGTGWSAIGNGVNNSINAMRISSAAGKMFIGGSFTILDGTTGAYFVGSFTDSDNPLPVELTSFTANISGSKVTLNWQTATEVNNYGFEVERSLSSHSSSLNGHSLSEVWETIGFVAGSGNSNSLKEYSFTDIPNHSSIQPYNHSFRYRLKQIDNDGKFEYSKEIEVDILRPSTFDLRQNYPNPFNPSTVISYQLTVDSKVSLKIFDILGNEVAVLVQEEQKFGSYEVKFNATGLASGTYIYRLIAGDFVSTKKMIVLK